MGLIEIIKPLSTVLSSAVNKSQYQEKLFLGAPRIKLGVEGFLEAFGSCLRVSITV